MPSVSVYLSEQNATAVAEISEVEISVSEGQRGRRGSKIFFGPIPPVLPLTPEEYGEEYLLDDVFIVTTDGTYNTGDIFQLTYDGSGNYTWVQTLVVSVFNQTPQLLQTPMASSATVSEPESNVATKEYVDQQLELLALRAGIDPLNTDSTYTHGVEIQ